MSRHLNTLRSRIIEEELNKDINSVFKNFDQTLIASASLAQVHFATLSTGEVVAVKIQRLGMPNSKISIRKVYLMMLKLMLVVTAYKLHYLAKRI